MILHKISRFFELVVMLFQ